MIAYKIQFCSQLFFEEDTLTKKLIQIILLLGTCNNAHNRLTIWVKGNGMKTDLRRAIVKMLVKLNIQPKDSTYKKRRTENILSVS